MRVFVENIFCNFRGLTCDDADSLLLWGMWERFSNVGMSWCHSQDRRRIVATCKTKMPAAKLSLELLQHHSYKTKEKGWAEVGMRGGI